MTNSSQLKIENLTDLLKISPDKLKTAQFSDFSGKYFEQIYTEVLKSESKLKPKKQKEKIESHEFNELNNNFDRNAISINRKDKNKNKIGYILDNKTKLPITIYGYNNYENNEEDFYSIKKIIFNIHYNTLFGQEIAISGSSYKLGNWDKNNLFFLNWTKGNKWIGTLDIDDNSEDFEFKFVLCYDRNIICWEPGENNNVYFTALLNEIKEFQKGKFNKYEYEYNQDEGELNLYCYWPR